jgi:hypothetical protein
MIRNLHNGLKLLDHFVTVQNTWMAKHQQPLIKNIPELWDADKGGMHGLSADDWLDIMAAYQNYIEQFRPRCEFTMLQAANDLENMLLDDLERFHKDLQKFGSSRYKTAAWKFMCNFRDTVNADEGLDPFKPSNRFRELFEVQ